MRTPYCLIPQHPLLTTAQWQAFGSRRSQYSYWAVVGYHGYHQPVFQVRLARRDYFDD